MYKKLKLLNHIKHHVVKSSFIKIDLFIINYFAI